MARTITLPDPVSYSSAARRAPHTLFLVWHDLVVSEKLVWFDTTLAEFQAQLAALPRVDGKPDADDLSDGVADLGYSWAAWFIDPSRNCLAIVQPKE